MKEHILKYIELSPNMGYYDLVKIFGLSMKELLNLLDITNYKIYGDETYFEVYDNNGNEIYYEDLNNFWIKSKYDANGRLIYEEFSSGDWYKYEYDVNGKKIYFEDSDGEKTYY